jgi:ribose transport system substrate-binding protein
MRTKHSLKGVIVPLMGAATMALAACGGGDGGGGGGGGGSAAGEKKEPRTITLIQGVRGDEFYISMQCGAQEAADAAGAKLNVQGPEEFDAAQQTQILNAVVAEKPDAILIAPTDVKAMIPPLLQAKEAGIKIVTVDTVTEDESIPESAIATDNLESGRIAARTLTELVEDKSGALLVVNVKPGISTTDQRQQGFEEEIKKIGGFKYLGGEYSNNDPAKAAQIVNSTISAEPDLAGIFATNLFAAEGSATGLRQSGEKGVRVVGFDAGPAQVKQLEEGIVQALIAQKPAEIGKLGVEQAIAALDGQPVKKKIATGTEVITQDNVDEPASQEALYKSKC